MSYVYGEKLSPNGSLLFQPTTSGIDVVDARLGNLLTRISLPVNLSPNYDALVSDGKDNVLVAITGTNGDGIAVIDLSSIPEPSPLPYEARPASAQPVAMARNAPYIRHSSRSGDCQHALSTRPAEANHTARDCPEPSAWVVSRYTRKAAVREVLMDLPGPRLT